MSVSRKINTIIGLTAILGILAVPVMVDTTIDESLFAVNGYGLTTGDSPNAVLSNLDNTLLLARGGNGNGGGSGRGKGGHGGRDGNKDQDRDRKRDNSCLDNITTTTNATALILAGNGSGSSDQKQDRDQKQDGSCDDALTSNVYRTGDQDGDSGRDRDRSCQVG